MIASFTLASLAANALSRDLTWPARVSAARRTLRNWLGCPTTNCATSGLPGPTQ